jgi:hypothetical protein
MRLHTPQQVLNSRCRPLAAMAAVSGSFICLGPAAGFSDHYGERRACIWSLCPHLAFMPVSGVCVFVHA